MRPKLARPSPAFVISLVALFVALGGTGYAAIKISGKNVKNRSLTGKDLKKNSIGRNEVKESSLGTVRRALQADSAGVAGSARTSTSAGDAARLGGSAPASYLPGAFVPAQLKNGWVALGEGNAAPGYWKGPGPVVHLQGAVKSGPNDSVVFTLPPDARPKTGKRFLIHCQVRFGLARVGPSGDVEILQSVGENASDHSFCPNFAFLDGVDFRTDT